MIQFPGQGPTPHLRFMESITSLLAFRATQAVHSLPCSTCGRANLLYHTISGISDLLECQSITSTDLSEIPMLVEGPSTQLRLMNPESLLLRSYASDQLSFAVPKISVTPKPDQQLSPCSMYGQEPNHVIVIKSSQSGCLRRIIDVERGNNSVRKEAEAK